MEFIADPKSKFQRSRITKIRDEALPQLSRDVLTILELNGRDLSFHVGLAAVVSGIRPLQVINCQGGRTRQKRNVTLIDESYKQINLGLWPDFKDALREHQGKRVISKTYSLESTEAN